MDRPLSRIQPARSAGAYQTYALSQQPDMQVRAACEDVDCPNRRRGWQTILDETQPNQAYLADYIRRRSGRTFREQRAGDGSTVFTFEPGQRCFADHKTNPQIFLVRGGDWRRNFGLIRRHQSPADWVEDFGEHQQRISDQLERG